MQVHFLKHFENIIKYNICKRRYSRFPIILGLSAIFQLLYSPSRKRKWDILYQYIIINDQIRTFLSNNRLFGKKIVRSLCSFHLREEIENLSAQKKLYECTLNCVYSDPTVVFFHVINSHIRSSENCLYLRHKGQYFPNTQYM